MLYPTSKIGFLIFFFPARSSKKDMLTLSENPRTSFRNHKLKFTLCQKHVLILPSVCPTVFCFCFALKFCTAERFVNFVCHCHARKFCFCFSFAKNVSLEKSYRFRFILVLFYHTTKSDPTPSEFALLVRKRSVWRWGEF
uniref:(northern house mosquito) hypothetical protein n=1 Tax=Culex pipiens TaxID=7175 RepID=A0A8D8A4Z7_CULPI